MPQSVPDFSMTGREPPSMGLMAHGFAALGDAAQHAVCTIAALAADAAQAPHRLDHAVNLLTGDGQLGTLWQVMAPFAALLLAAVAAALAVNHLLAFQRRALAKFRPSSAALFARGLARALVVEAAPVAVYSVVAAGGSFLLFWGRGSSSLAPKLSKWLPAQSSALPS